MDFGPEEFAAAADVSRETLDRLVAFASELERWNAKINLISPKTLPELWQRHILDSAQVFAYRKPQDRNWVDLGAGGGFPGLVVAILAKEYAPEMRVTLIESDLRKSAFLSSVARTLDLPVTVISQRIEAAPPQGADVVSARALAALDVLLPLAARHLAPDGRALLLKGASYQDELAKLGGAWSFDLAAHPSKSGSDGVILEIGALTHA
ncbi:MAG: 16S rRNA (guanine(527)-N(7))-methyltransferase RsmG [Paracoccaceae bacterium]|nr:16S rRNA (guanine(527)-N(7))-methyltransferase RsmG [Paracoccaceae bacterium]